MRYIIHVCLDARISNTVASRLHNARVKRIIFSRPRRHVGVSGVFSFSTTLFRRASRSGFKFQSWPDAVLQHRIPRVFQMRFSPLQNPPFSVNGATFCETLCRVYLTNSHGL